MFGGILTTRSVTLVLWDLCLIQVLIEVGDKESSFLGSKQWIGSFEVSIVLNHLLGVTSRITNVPSGAEMGSTGRELLRHFEEEGTPVMIGALVCVVQISLTFLCVCVCICACVHASIHVCVPFMYVCTCMSVHMCTCVYCTGLTCLCI